MADPASLYSSILRKHFRNPANRGELDSFTHCGFAVNRICGDEISVQLQIEGEKILHAAFEGKACAMCIASASILTQKVRDVSPAMALDLALRLESQIRGEREPESWEDADLAALAVIRDYPGRVSCASLPWQALLKCLETHSQRGCK